MLLANFLHYQNENKSRKLELQIQNIREPGSFTYLRIYIT